MRYCRLLLLICLAAAPSASAQPPAGSPRRTRQVEIIERVGASVVAVFSEGKDNNWGSGSGTIIHPSGYILTNDHVVQDRRGVVLVRDQPPLPFRTIGRMWDKDLAIIKVDAPQPLVALPLGRSHDILAGEPILVGGNPGGRGIVFSSGIISSVEVMPGMSALTMSGFPDDMRDRFIQFDATSNPGNSGGPIINAEGRQVAVVVAKILQEQNINYAIPVDRARRGLRDMLLPEQRGNFWTGLELGLATATIERIAPGGPADQAGLKPGDVVVGLGEVAVTSDVEFFVALVGRKAGESLSVKYLRDEQPQAATLTLAEYPLRTGLAVEGRQPGLKYRLYRGDFRRCPDLSKQTPVDQGTIPKVRLDQVPRIPDDHYALGLEGYLEIPETGVWTVAVASDDGSRVFLDGELLIDNDGLHPTQWTAARDRWQKGLHALRVEFFEGIGDAELQLALSRDGSAELIEPTLFADADAAKP
ncbi:MAG TPA: trypsin-like peptidase domain-containing protein [Pirellulales bacterium]|nr:trypsin-like peptidase domain-containing protein [Pirellulales bacterium]